MSVTGARVFLPAADDLDGELTLVVAPRGTPVRLRVVRVGQIEPLDDGRRMVRVDYVSGQVAERAALALALFRPPDSRSHPPPATETPLVDVRARGERAGEPLPVGASQTP